MQAMMGFLNRVSELKNYMHVGFRENFRRNNQEHDNDVFVRLPVPSAQCFIGTEKHPDAGIYLCYADDKLSRV